VSLVPSTSMYSKIWYFLCVLVLCTQVNMFVMLLWVCIHTGQAEKFAWLRWESNPPPLGMISKELDSVPKYHQLEPTSWPRSSVGRALD
jgi:hypothetical protein